MVRAIGAALVIASTSLWGVSRAFRLSARERRLRELSASLALLKGEICFRLCPMDQALSAVTARCVGPVRAFYCAVLRGMDGLGAETFASVWTEAAEKSPQLLLSPGELAALAELGASLGRYDAALQGEALDRACAFLDRCAVKAARERQDQSRLSVVLGMAAGFFAVIVLL